MDVWNDFRCALNVRRAERIKSRSFCDLARSKKKDPFVCLQFLHVLVISTMQQLVELRAMFGSKTGTKF